MYEFADRLKNIPPYLFAEIEEKVSKKKAEGIDIIDFGIGDPDLPTPKLITDEIKKQLDDPQHQPEKGKPALLLQIGIRPDSE